MKILVLGSMGQLGRCLADNLVDPKNEVIFLAREEIDITDMKLVKQKITIIHPDLVINAAAYTAVDRSEEDQDLADLVNHLAVNNIANICSKIKCWLIHISTDYVFKGNSKIPYSEKDHPNPQNVYGNTKLRGELAIQSSGCKYLIIRTAWVFSEYGNNFLKTMLQLGKKNNLDIVDDQIGSPTYAQDIARTIAEIISKKNFNQISSGIYHYCGNSSCSWHDFAMVIFKEAKVKNLSVPNLVHSVKTRDYPTLAKRPAFSILDCKKIKQDFNIDQSDWRSGVAKAINKIQT